MYCSASVVYCHASNQALLSQSMVSCPALQREPYSVATHTASTSPHCTDLISPTSSLSYTKIQEQGLSTTTAEQLQPCLILWNNSQVYSNYNHTPAKLNQLINPQHRHSWGTNCTPVSRKISVPSASSREAQSVLSLISWVSVANFHLLENHKANLILNWKGGEFFCNMLLRYSSVWRMAGLKII